MKKQKLQKLLKVFTVDKTAVDFTSLDTEIARLKNGLKEKVKVSTLEEVGIALEKFKRSLDLQPIIDSMDELRLFFDEKNQEITDTLNQKYTELDTADKTREQNLILEISDLKIQLSTLEEIRKKDLNTIKDSIPNLTDLEQRLCEMTTQLSSRVDALEEQEIKDWTNSIEKLRIEMMSRINNIGGGSMNRQVFFNSTDFLTKYTDINWKAGSNVTFTIANNNATKKVDITVSATGGGGGGTVRSINSISVDTSAGSTSGTDYVYLVSGTTTLTLPDATANTNLYTVKNVGTGVVTIATTSAQTIDGSLTIVMPVQYTAVDLISDTANWNVT